MHLRTICGCAYMCKYVLKCAFLSDHLQKKLQQTQEAESNPPSVTLS